MLRNVIFLVLVACAAVKAGQDDPLCKKYGSGHSACIADQECPKTPFPCGLPSDADKEAILKRINEQRQKVALGKETRGWKGKGQPAGKNIYELTWNDDLARVAQRWCITKKSGHDSYAARRTPKFHSVGQNGWAGGAGGWYPKWTWVTALGSWYNEVDSFNYPDIAAPGKMVGHYTQNVWAETYEIGCGAWVWKDGIWNNLRVYCNFGPAGNVGGVLVYKTTGSCTKSSSKYPGLCAR